MLSAEYYNNKRDAFTKAGFRRSTESCSIKAGCIALYQKRIRRPSDNQTVYFINVWEYSFPNSMPEVARARYQFSIEATMYRESGETMRVELHWEPETMTPESIQEFYGDVHQRLGCGVDLLNN